MADPEKNWGFKILECRICQRTGQNKRSDNTDKGLYKICNEKRSYYGKAEQFW